MARLTQCFLFLLAIAAARATVSSIEIFSGNFYGVDEEQGIITIQASGPSLPDDVNVQPITTEVDQEQPSNGRAGSHRHGHHHRGRHGHRHHHRHHHNTTIPQWSDEQKLTHICAMIRPTNSNVTSRRSSRYHGTIMSRKLQMLSAENRQTVTDMWNRRKQDMLRCCNEDSSDRKLQCVNEVRTLRYDRVCRGEEPLCPWAQFLSDNRHSRPGRSASGSTDSTSNTTAICCMRQGSERLECFGTARTLYQRQYELMKSKTHHGRRSDEERRRTESDAAARGDERTPNRRGSGGSRRQRPDGGD